MRLVVMERKYIAHIGRQIQLLRDLHEVERQKILSQTPTGVRSAIIGMWATLWGKKGGEK